MEWIDAKNKMPDKAGDYLVTTKNGYVCIGKLYHTLYGEPYWNGRLRDCVIAWMPLPEKFESEN